MALDFTISVLPSASAMSLISTRKWLSRQIKVKWWDNFDTSRIGKSAISESFHCNPKFWNKRKKPEATQELGTLKQQLLARMAQAKTPDEFSKILSEIQEQTKSVTSKSDTDEDETQAPDYDPDDPNTWFGNSGF